MNLIRALAALWALTDRRRRLVVGTLVLAMFVAGVQRTDAVRMLRDDVLGGASDQFVPEAGGPSAADRQRQPGFFGKPPTESRAGFGQGEPQEC